MSSYRIVRFYYNAGIRRRIMCDRLTLVEAQDWCNNPETSSTTAKKPAAKARTRALGPWFDGYEAY